MEHFYILKNIAYSKKCKTIPFPRYWRTHHDDLYYTVPCNEDLTISNIRMKCFSKSIENMLSDFLECFVVDLFTNDNNRTDLQVHDHFMSDEYDLYTQSYLEAINNAHGHKQSVPQLNGSKLTPDVYIVIRQKETSDEVRIAIDAVDCESEITRREAMNDKIHKYAGISDHVIVIASVKGQLFFDITKKSQELEKKSPELAKKSPEFALGPLSDIFKVTFGKKILKGKVEQNSIFSYEYDMLRSEYEYWATCAVHRKIVKTSGDRKSVV